MRLRDIEHVLSEETSALILPAGEKQNNAIGIVRLVHRRRLQQALHALKAIAPLNAAAVDALKQDIFREPGEPALVLDEKLTTFNAHHLNPLSRRARDLLAAIESILPEEKPFSFAYRFPDRELDLKGLDAEVGELKLMFDEPLAWLTGERTTVEALDRGSFVVELVAATAAGVWVVSLLCRAAKTLVDTRHHYRTQELQYESLGLDVEHKANIVKANKAALEHVTRRLAEGITGKTAKAGDNEAANLVQVAIQKLSVELEQGATVLLAQNAPPEARALMPDTDGSPLLPENVIKELLAVNPPAELDATPSEEAAPEETEPSRPN